MLNPKASLPLFIAAEALSLFGNAAIGIVLPWLVLSRTGDPSIAGLVAAVAALPADDHRLPELAAASVALMEQIYPVGVAAEELPKWAPLDGDRYRLVSEHNLDASPAWSRLNKLVEDLARERGYPMPN